MSVDWSRPVQTREGAEVRIWVTDAKCSNYYPIQGECLCSDGEWYQESWTAEGHTNRDRLPRPNDLVNVPEKHSKVLTIYRIPHSENQFFWQGRLYDSSSEAKRHSSPHMFASIPIEFTEGEGLE